MVLDEQRSAAEVAEELGLSASTLRHWVAAERDRRRGQWWADQVTGVFEFLGDFGFTLVEVRASDWWEISAVYRAEHVALQVVFSVEYQRVEVRLMRAALLDLPGRGSRDRFFVTGVPGMRGHLAHRLVEREAATAYAGLEPDRVAAALEFWAGVVREHAVGFLRGDLSLLDSWESGWDQVVVTVYVGDNVTDRQEASAVARVRAVLPEATVVTKRTVAQVR